MEVTKYLCDIKGCNNEASHIKNTIQVVFHTDQTEGRSVKPYLSLEKLDLCNEHYDLVSCGAGIHGQGAQGFNTYWFINAKEF